MLAKINVKEAQRSTFVVLVQNRNPYFLDLQNVNPKVWRALYEHMPLPAKTQRSIGERMKYSQTPAGGKQRQVLPPGCRPYGPEAASGFYTHMDFRNE